MNTLLVNVTELNSRNLCSYSLNYSYSWLEYNSISIFFPFPKFCQSSDSVVKTQVAGSHIQDLWFSRSEVGPETLHSNKLTGNFVAAGSGRTLWAILVTIIHTPPCGVIFACTCILTLSSSEKKEWIIIGSSALLSKSDSKSNSYISSNWRYYCL